MEEASPSPVFSWPPGFPNACVIDPESSWLGIATSGDWFSGPDDLGWPLSSVWILRRSSWTLATSPPLLRRTRSSTSSYHCRSRRWPAAWHCKTSPNSCMRCPHTANCIDGPLSLRSSLLSFRGPRMQRSRLFCHHCCASSHHLVPGCRQKCCRPLVSLVAPAHQPTRTMGYRTPAAPSPCTSVEMAQSPPVAQYRVPTPLL